MFGGPLFGPDVRPAAQPVQQPAQPYGFDQALNDLIDFLGMGGTEQATANQLAAEEEGNPYAAPYQPQESANLQDQRAEQPNMQDAVRRWGGSPMGGEPDAKRAAARISLMPRGVVPFVSAAYDTATGEDNGLGLGGLYRKRQAEADMLAQDQQPGVAALHQYLPYAVGPAIGLLAPSQGEGMRKFGRTAVSGGVGGAIMGGLDSYFDRRFDQRSFDDPERLQSTGRGMLMGGAMGATTAAATHMGMDMAKGAMRGPTVARSQQRQAVEAPKESPIKSGRDWDGLTGAEIRERAFERRFDRDIKSAAKRMGLEPDELRAKIDADKRAVAGIPEKPAPRPEQPKGLAATAEPIKPAPEPAKPMPAKIERRPQRQTKAGQEAWAKVQERTRLDQARSDAIVMGNERRSLRELGTQRANVRIAPDTPEARFSTPGTKASYTPKEKRGVMELSEAITNRSGRQPSKWTNDDKEAFIASAARHTNMSPAKIKSMLTSYGEASTGRAKRGMGNARIREIVEAERAKIRNEK